MARALFFVKITALLVATARPAFAWYDGPSSSAFRYAYAPTRDLELSDCDDCVKNVSMGGFAFPFYGSTYTSVNVSTNGWISFGAVPTTSAPRNQELHRDAELNGPGIPGRLVAVWWDDWDPKAAGDVYYGRRTGPAYCGTAPSTADCFIVEWWGVKHYGDVSTSVYRFEVKLMTDGSIEMHYHTTASGNALYDGGASGSVGLVHLATTVGHGHLYDFAGLTGSTALRFGYPAPVAAYVHARDAVFQRPRPGLRVAQVFVCGSVGGLYGDDGVTDADGWGLLRNAACPQVPSPPWCGWFPCPSAVATQHRCEMAARDASGFTIATVPNQGWDVLVGDGNFLFCKRSDMTPQQRSTHTWSLTYPWPSGTYTSSLDVWSATGPPYDRPLVIVPGFDGDNALNSGTSTIGDSAADYLLLLAPVIRTLHDDYGYDIMIGDWGRGATRLSYLWRDVSAWIDHAYHAAGNAPVQVAGVSMGGVALRRTLAIEPATAAKTRAWFSLDSPHRGANLGGWNMSTPANHHGGLQCLVDCKGEVAQKEKLNSPAARDMAFFVPDAWSCRDRPEECSCGMTAGQNIVASFPWPTATLPRYAIALGSGSSGDAGGVDYSTPMTGNGEGLWATWYRDMPSLWGCPDNGWFSWDAGGWDCMPGSRYFTGSSDSHGTYVNTTKFDPCEPWMSGGRVDVYLRWDPAFVPTTSALAGAANPQYTTSGCRWAPASSGVPAGAWTAWSANTYNAWHSEVPPGVASRVIQWMTTGAGHY